MARQVLPWVGAIVGNFIAPGVGASWGFAIGSAVGNLVDPMVIKGPEIGEGQTQSSTEGVPYNRIYGTACASGNVMCAGPMRKWIKKTQGGKGGPVNEQERMSRTFAIGITCHEIGGIIRIWEDERLVFDARGSEDAQVNDEDNREYAKSFRLFLGTEDQEPSSDLEIIYGAGNTPAYRGRSYIVFPDRDLTELGGRIPNFRFEVTTGEMVVYPEDRVPCVNAMSFLSSGGINPPNNQVTIVQRSFIRPVSSGSDIRVSRVRFSTEFNDSFYVSDRGPDGACPFRGRITDSLGNTIYSTGWICHKDQVSDVIALGTGDKIVSFDENDPRYNDGYFRIYAEVNSPNSGTDIYVVLEWGCYVPDTKTSFQGRSTVVVEGFDMSLYNPLYFVVHPFYPASLYNPTTGETLWACWADDEYEIRGRGGPSYLDEILRDVADYCEPGLDAKLNLAEVEGIEIDGFVIGQQYNAKNVISTLQQTHFFDPSEYDERIHFIKRGKPAEFVLTEQDLIDEDPYSQLRKSSIEYPRKLNLVYQNPISAYDTTKETASRSSPSVFVSGEKTITVPEVMTAQKAARIVDMQMKVAWAEAFGKFEFSVPATVYDAWVPSDLVVLYLKDTPYRLRIDRIERADGVLKMEASSDRQSAYTSSVTTLPDRPPTPPPPRLAGAMRAVFLNIPALVDSNDLLGYYVGTSGTTQAYSGGVVERRLVDLDDDYRQILSVDAGRTMANLTAPIRASSEHYRDTTNTLEITVWGLDLEAFQTVSDTNLLRENNAIAVVSPDRKKVEIMQFKTAEFLGAGKYRLSHLIRGRLNTNPQSFPANSTVVWLEDVSLVVADASQIGLKFEHRATAYGEDPQASETTVDDFSKPLMQTEWPVELLRYELDGTTATVRWSPRERFGTDVNPIRSVNWEGYLVVYSDGITTEEFTTEDPVHVKDLSSFTGGAVEVSVSQINRYTGAGPAQTIEIEL